jgi:hypothetical protein
LASRVIVPFCRRYLDFASSDKHEYELIHADWSARLNRDEPRPSFELLKRRLADRLGGKPDDHRRMALAIAALSYGTATQLLIPGVHDSVLRELRRSRVMAAESLVESARELRKWRRTRRRWGVGNAKESKRRPEASGTKTDRNSAEGSFARIIH